MFKPEYRITPFLISLFEKIAAQIATIESSHVQLTARLRLEKDAMNRNVHSSTWIEGNLLSLAQVAAISDKGDTLADQKQKQEVSNCLNAMRWVLKNKRKLFTEKQLLQLHQLMVEDLLSKSQVGLYRKVQNYIIDAKKVVIYTPPAPSKVSPLMKELFHWLKSSVDQHPIIRSAIFHHQFVSIHPFIDGNGRVARAGAQWILLERGFEPLYTLSLDEYFANDRDKYYQMIQQARELDGDYTYWIEYVAQGILDAVGKTASRARHLVHFKSHQKVHLTQKQEELLILLKDEGLMTSTQMCALMKVNRARINQLIAPLVKAGLVFREGKTRGARYGLVRV